MFTPSLIAIVAVNIFLMLFAQKILSVIYHEPEDSLGFRKRANTFRIFNAVIILSFITSRLFSDSEVTNPAYTLFSVVIVLYLSYAGLHLFNYWVRVKYGKHREVDGEQQVLDTYNSRLLNIFAAVFIFIIALISIVGILGFDSLLEAGGAIGIVGVFLALTQNAWAPDIISGLVILNSKMMDVGDVVTFNDGEKTLGIVYKTRIFYTEILNLTNNHRIMIKNARLRDQTIHNLSKFASAKGLRECLTFKIDYAVESSKIKAMFESTFERAINDEKIKLESNYPVEIRVGDTADFAVEWCCYYYTKDIKNIITTRQKLREMVLETAKQMDISLATPTLNLLTPRDI
jgi:small-conductance mechanosensitive channel